MPPVPGPPLPVLGAGSGEVPWRSDFEKDFGALVAQNPQAHIFAPLPENWGLALVQHFVPLFALAVATSSNMRHHLFDAWWQLGGGDAANPECKRTPFCMPLPSPWGSGGMLRRKFPGMEVVLVIVTILLVLNPFTAFMTLLLYLFLALAST